MILIFQQVSFERQFRPLFQNIHCHLQAGELLYVTGPNGCGKSTLLRILAGLIEPTHGMITWNGKNILEQREHYQQELNYLGHRNAIKSHLTVFENSVLAQMMYATSIQSTQINAALTKCSLHLLSNKLARTLSAGQSRRLALTRLLLHPAKIWILDEPTTALDKAGQQLLMQLLQQHLKENGIVIMATHHDFHFDCPTQHICLGEKYE